MTQALAARKIKIHDLKVKFGLQQIDDEDFFREWLDELPELSNVEKKRVRQD